MEKYFQTWLIFVRDRVFTALDFSLPSKATKQRRERRARKDRSGGSQFSAAAQAAEQNPMEGTAKSDSLLRRLRPATL